LVWESDEKIKPPANYIYKADLVEFAELAFLEIIF
jgi:hypothetical protein